MLLTIKDKVNVSTCPMFALISLKRNTYMCHTLFLLRKATNAEISRGH